MSGVEDVKSEKMAKDLEKVKERNNDLLLSIAQLCKRPNRTYPEVVFLLGLPGAGKSAIVNTIVKALCGKFYSKAVTGKGHAVSKTLILQRLVRCGLQANEMEPIEKNILKKGLSKLPTIIDAAGTGDEDSEKFKEILRVYFGGFVPSGTSIQFVENLQKEHGIGTLQYLLESSDENKVTKVVFVASCKQSFPEKLVECLHSVLQEYDDRSGKPKYPVDVFVVITKYDLVKDQHIYEARDKEEDYITEECFEKFEAEVVNNFSIEGSKENNCIRWVSYVDGHGSDNPHIDNIALRFVEKMMQPRRGHDYGRPSKEAAANMPLVPMSKILKLKAKKKMAEFLGVVDRKCLFIFALVVGLLAVFYQLLTKGL
ncbi:uncharacterized protein LOC128223843 isoform X2 [Mya arenaria]|uniref:uncharacterized protein LOC128223843 isoform X2 n=1 Tax=Mya arenaria TaxID=6604 RepID=UPI0022E8F3EA|nr:uncharacterized protein LOC128223843 isoform X2 [Mya arenaria]